MRVRGWLAGCGIAFATPFVLVALVLFWARVDRYREARAAARHVLVTEPQAKLPARGPVVVRGRLVVEGERRATDATGASPASALYAYRSDNAGGIKNTVVHCRESNVRGARARIVLACGVDRATELRLDPLLDGEVDWQTVGTFGDRGARVRVFAQGRSEAQEVASTALPVRPAASCAPPGKKARFELAELRDGDPITVVACREGDSLVPCRDGLDAISTRPARELVPLFFESRTGPQFAEIWCSVVGLVFGALALLAASPSIVRSREGARDEGARA